MDFNVVLQTIGRESKKAKEAESKGETSSHHRATRSEQSLILAIEFSKFGDGRILYPTNTDLYQLIISRKPYQKQINV